ncbi:hypothetical protein [Candidatus Magnetominusculus dajiuhuensis]|uniref:hypothetical protein n=1 Tax=Candidatus Magnetominusculus dajiuhuensis TaxID=3137712 RepID=UPI003B428769
MGRVNLQERIADAIGQYDNDDAEQSSGVLKQLNIEHGKINKETAVYVTNPKKKAIDEG